MCKGFCYCWEASDKKTSTTNPTINKHISWRFCLHGMYVCMYVCMHACMDGWMDGWMDGCVCKHAYVLHHICVNAYPCTQSTRSFRGSVAE